MTGLDGEIRYDIIQLDAFPLRIIGPVQGPSLLTPLAEKVTIGEHTRADDVLLSSWVVSNLRGGLGVARLDTATQSDRYRFGTAWVLQDQEILLPALPTEITTGFPVGSEALVSTTYANHLYMAFGPDIRFFDDATQAFVTPTEAGYAALPANATDMFVIRLVDKDWLCIADANGLAKFDGTTWTYTAGNGTTLPLAQWLEEFDHRLYTLDVNNNLWSSLDLVTWTKHAGSIPVRIGDVKGLDIFFDPSERPALHAPVTDGLWLYDDTGDVWLRTRLRFPRHKEGGRGHVQWRDEYFESSGLVVYHYLGTVVTPAGLDRDDSLPKDFQGTIVALEALPSHLAAAVSSETVAGGMVHYPNDAHNFDASRATDLTAPSAIYLWTGSAWQPLWVSPVAGSTIHFLHYSDADNTYRLWWGANDRVYYCEFANAVFQPRLAPTWPFAQTAYIETGRFDKGWPEQVGVGIRTKVRLKKASATERVLIYYRVDQNDPTDPWTFLGTADQNGLTIFDMEDTAGTADGLLFYDFEYKVVLERGSDSSVSPTLVFCKLEYARRPDARFGYRMQVVVDEDVGGHTPEEVVTHLQGLATNKHIVQFEYRPTGRSPITRKCMVSQWTAVTMPGLETTGRWMLAVVEP